MTDFIIEFERACSKPHDGDAFEGLPERDKILIAIWGLEGDVNNGGFDQYYFNAAGDQASFAPDALDRIGATNAAAIVREANSHFGIGGPAQNREQRVGKLAELTAANEQLFDVLDERFYAYPDDISSLLRHYLKTERDGHS